MRTFDFTNGKQFPETLHVRKSVPYLFFDSYEHGWYRRDIFLIDMIRFWVNASLEFSYFRKRKRQQQSLDDTLYDFVQYVIERVPIYFVSINQIGTAIEVQETACSSMYETIVPDNHITVPLISEDEMGNEYKKWEIEFRERIAEIAEIAKITEGLDSLNLDPFKDSFLYEICPNLKKADKTKIEIEVGALYCPIGGDPKSEKSNPEIFVYMDYFVDADGKPTHSTHYLTYLVAHELAHAMMDEKLWDAFLCKNEQTLSKGLSHRTKSYYLHEEALATAVGWHMVGCCPDVAEEIMQEGLPYSFGLSPYYHNHMDGGLLLCARIPEWLSAKMHNPIPYL